MGTMCAGFEEYPPSPILGSLGSIIISVIPHSLVHSCMFFSNLSSECSLGEGEGVGERPPFPLLLLLLLLLCPFLLLLYLSLLPLYELFGLRISSTSELLFPAR